MTVNSSLSFSHPPRSQLLRHLYTGDLDFPAARLRPLLELADRLLLPRVAERAQQQLLAAASPGGVVEDMLWAERMGFDQLLAGLKVCWLCEGTRATRWPMCVYVRFAGTQNVCGS